jgi:hypothetical protein
MQKKSTFAKMAPRKNATLIPVYLSDHFRKSRFAEAV